MKYALLIGFVVACSSTPPAGEPAKPSEPVVEAAPTPSRVVTEHFHSDALGVDKAVVIYLPRGYDSQPARRWPSTWSGSCCRSGPRRSRPWR